MGFFKEQEIEVQAIAHDMGDDFGQDADTILIIARIMEMDPAKVQEILTADHDEDPREHMEYYGA